MRLDRVLIVGGGIAGMCTALALRHRRIAGEIDIVELNPKWDVYGAGILLAANALRALDTFGLADRVIAGGYPSPSTILYAPNGVQINELVTPPIAGTSYPSILGIARPVLHRILQAAIREAGVRVVLGVTVDAIEHTGSHVTVQFSDGREATYDLVVGADGLRSKVRRLAFPEVPPPRYEDQMVWRYAFPFRAEGLDASWIYLGDPKVGVAPMAQNAMYMFITEGAPGQPLRFPEEQLAEEMRKRLAGYQHVPRLVALAEAMTDPARVVLRPFETILVPKPWHRGRIVLVGDAAHTLTAHTAQGGAMAIEDTVVLAEELDRHQELEAALTAYVERRFDRVRRMWEYSLELCVLERTHDPRAPIESPKLMAAATELAAQPI